MKEDIVQTSKNSYVTSVRHKGMRQNALHEGTDKYFCINIEGSTVLLHSSNPMTDMYWYNITLIEIKVLQILFK
jgi:hypothetical protein